VNLDQKIVIIDLLHGLGGLVGTIVGHYVTAAGVFLTFLLGIANASSGDAPNRVFVPAHLDQIGAALPCMLTHERAILKRSRAGIDQEALRRHTAQAREFLLHHAPDLAIAQRDRRLLRALRRVDPYQFLA